MLTPSIPRCNATNYHEFWCTEANVSDTFESLATKLHVNPNKLAEYNFLYNRAQGVKAGDSLRVPFDQCTMRPGVFKCYSVVQGDTLLTVAANHQSVRIDAEVLKNANLDILHGESTLYAGMQLRLPLHTCFEDEIHDCHIATSEDTLQTIATTYSTSPQQICKSNPESFGTNYCDPAVAPLPDPHVGMELLVPRLYATPPSPCKEVDGYWSCYTVLAEDTIWGSIARRTKTDPQYLMEANFGKDPTRCKDCSSCASPSPDCLKVGQVLVVPVSTCTEKPVNTQ
jgi:LysM repeat protein